MLHLIAALLVAAALAPAAAQAAGPSATRSALASQMRSAGGGSGALAVDLDSGRQIFASRPDTARTPASVNKLFTTSTALSLYGVDGHLTTRALGDVGVDPGGVLIGNLYLRGGGDPSFGSRQAAELADELVLDQGLREITGRVIGDESAFDSLRGAAVRGLPHHERGRAAERADLQPRPLGPAPPVLPEEPRALRRPRVRARAAAPRRDQRRRPRPAARPPAALPLAEHSSPTIAELARVTNRPSDNFNAETLIKALGAEFGTAGTTRAGTRRRAPHDGGLRPAPARGRRLRPLARQPHDAAPGGAAARAHGLGGRRPGVRDLARGRRAQRHARSTACARSVARDRCQAKTGTLNSVSALAGYCQTTAGVARRLRVPHERRQRLRRPPAAGPDGRRARALLALTSRWKRLRARSIDSSASSRGYQPSTLTTFHSGVL